MNEISNASSFSSESEFQKVRIIKSAGSNDVDFHHNTWTSLTHIGSSGANNNFFISGTTQGFSFFNGGKDDGESLPVELLTFNGSCTAANIELHWQTASEYNSSHFDLEYSRDGVHWNVVNTQESAGNSTELNQYYSIQTDVASGTNYYRLVQFDIDGISKTYDPIVVSCQGNNKGQFSVYPNPSTSAFQVIVKNNPVIGSAQIKLIDAMGSEAMHRDIEIGNGINTYMINQDFAPGIYYLILIDKNLDRQLLKHVIR